mmetsp:Transcript_13078/g.12679  ORF Transcript_13078/g.12679 Transcript_13078/m.12679 type:complete len:452 (+) Transcript_13078:128-1483(+)|eukprot:CAMPEP_0119048584 /NCGR_PEP_ID=MMETSP1177-20130426/59637_1 /TAXON_ID=2985 /ORGANISM="Ochromonas sp, Strain CCMP1899" /LENGTH=451 /DNA_ID=CAMNT_0007024657 /DNA_START=108 /DNA_END=1463 /DNA_ORIENTATION=-
MSVIDCVLYDMDGVLASVGDSYRESIIKTAARFGAIITSEDVSIEKKNGNANNDWILSKKLIESKKPGCMVTIEEVTEVFEEIYQGTATTPGLCRTETLIPSKGLLEEVNRRCGGKVGIITGRPRKDCDTFLVTHGLTEIFDIDKRVCMEDGPPKPSPDIVYLLCKKLGHLPDKSCIIIGDTPDDIRAGVAAGIRTYGVLTPDEEAKLMLKIVKSSQTMTDSLTSAGADGILKAGLAGLLDLISNKNILNAVIPKIKERVGEVIRETKETFLRCKVKLDGEGKSNISTGLGFLDHMFSQLAKHGRFDIDLECKGDLHIDDHHTAEDSALALGEAFDRALGPREGIRRFGNAYCPLDEALSRVVVDISSRPTAIVNLNLTREMIGTISSEMLKHVLESFAATARITLHVHNIHGENNHHKVESSFKALGVAMRQAVSRDDTAGVPSTKGVLA